MSLGVIPVTDAPAYTGWSEEDRELFNAYPFFLTKIQAERKGYYTTYNKMVKPRKWTPNMGPIMRGVRMNPSPHLRQEFMPDIIKNLPRKDVIDLRETTVDANIRRHRFESQMFNWFPQFNDFWPHLQEHGKDIIAKIERAEDLFLRTAFFHCSPFAFVIKDGDSVDLISTIPWDGTGTMDTATQGKTTAVRKQLCDQATGPLSIKSLLHAATIMETELGIPFFKGSEISKDDAPLDGKFLFVTSAEAYNYLSFDPTFLAYKSADRDAVNKGFSGLIQGRVTTKLESLPLRIKGGTGEFPAPERRVGDNNNLDEGETQPSQEYSKITECSHEVGFICGPSGYESIEVGPPPKDFAKDEMPHNFPAMEWNGKVRLTKQFLTEYVNDDTGEVERDIDAYGESLKWISQATFGVLPVQRRNIIPVFYKRARIA